MVSLSGVGNVVKVIAKVESALKGDRARFNATKMSSLTYWPLHSQLSPDEQDEAVGSVAPSSDDGKLGRKLIVATNIAETSITLTGVTHVIDPCRVKSKTWNPRDESWSPWELWGSILDNTPSAVICGCRGTTRYP